MHRTKRGRKKRRIKIQGGSFWSKLKKGVSKGAKYIKDKKMISKVAKALGHDTVGNIAEQVDFGKKRRRRGRKCKKIAMGRREFNGGASQPAVLNAYLKSKVGNI